MALFDPAVSIPLITVDKDGYLAYLGTGTFYDAAVDVELRRDAITTISALAVAGANLLVTVDVLDILDVPLLVSVDVVGDPILQTLLASVNVLENLPSLLVTVNVDPNLEPLFLDTVQRPFAEVEEIP